jgi:uncharacterized protein
LYLWHGGHFWSVLEAWYNFLVISLIEERREQIAALCRKYGIRRLDLFGSAAAGDFETGKSDVDFFYEFDDRDSRSLADRFFDFQKGLEELLGSKVDLISARDASNPFFLQVANRHRLTLYAA